MTCTKRCCVVDKMHDDLISMLEKEFPNHREYKLSYTTEDDERVHIHIENEMIKLSTIRKIESLHYKIVSMWSQAHNAISIAVVPDEVYVK